MEPFDLDGVLLALAALFTALGSVVFQLTTAAKIRAETAGIRRAAEHAATQASSAAAAVTPNHGSSMADAVRRTETRLTELARSIGGLREDIRSERAAASVHQQSCDTAHNLLADRIDALTHTATHH